MLTKEEYIKMLEHIRTLEEAVQNESAITEKVTQLRLMILNTTYVLCHERRHTCRTSTRH